jgi:hypothetical protein
MVSLLLTGYLFEASHRAPHYCQADFRPTFTGRLESMLDLFKDALRSINLYRVRYDRLCILGTFEGAVQSITLAGSDLICSMRTPKTDKQRPVAV